MRREDTNDVPKMIIIILRNMEFNRIHIIHLNDVCAVCVCSRGRRERMWKYIWQQSLEFNSPSRNYYSGWIIRGCAVCVCAGIRTRYSRLECTSRERGLANRSFMCSQRAILMAAGPVDEWNERASMWHANGGRDAYAIVIVRDAQKYYYYLWTRRIMFRNNKNH